jgi:DNA-binding GntR family transcriptional regulator
MALAKQIESRLPSPAVAAKRPARSGSTKPGRGFGAAAVYEGLREDILSLRLQPGTLLDETELAGLFKVSRSPVREALIRLSGEGLVQTLRNRSSIVAHFDVAMIQSHLNALVLMYCLTARLAAANCTPAQLDELRRLVRAHRAEMKQGDRAKLVANNRDFHVAIAVAGGNPIFVSWMTTVLDQGQRLMGLYLEDVGGKRSDAMLDEHVAIVEAIAAADPDAAEKAARDDAMILFDQLQTHLFKDQLRGADLGALTRTRS